MFIRGVFIFVLVTQLGAAPLQNPWNSLKFQDSYEDKSTEDYVYGARQQYGSPSSRQLLRSMEDDSTEYGRRKYSSYGTIQKSSPYSPLRSVGGNDREYVRYGRISYNMPSQKQQRSSHRYFDDDSDESYDMGYQHLYKRLQAGRGYPSRRRDTNALYTVY